MANSSLNQPRHLYPQKIGLRAQRLIQGTLFYNVLADTTIGIFFSEGPNAVERVKAKLIESGWREDTYEISWSCFEEYINEFKNPIYQHAVFSIISHWDWYISNIGKFIYFAEGQVSPDKKRDKDLLKLNNRPFAKQIDIIKKQTGIALEIKDDELDLVEEMHLVRNLGLHNQWEVDETYLKYSKAKIFSVGDKRLVETPELEKWHSAFIDLILEMSFQLATLYAGVPNYS